MKTGIIKLDNNNIFLVKGFEERVQFLEKIPGRSFFLFYPVYITNRKKMIIKDFEEDGNGIRKGTGEFILDGKYVERYLLKQYLEKNFDKECVLNKNRHDFQDEDDLGKYPVSFRPYLTSNYYTIETVTNILEEIRKDKLSSLCDEKIDDVGDILMLHGVEVDFYNEFSKRIRSMLKDNPNASALVVTGV